MAFRDLRCLQRLSISLSIHVPYSTVYSRYLRHRNPLSTAFVGLLRLSLILVTSLINSLYQFDPPVYVIYCFSLMFTLRSLPYPLTFIYRLSLPAIYRWRRERKREEKTGRNTRLKLTDD